MTGLTQVSHASLRSVESQPPSSTTPANSASVDSSSRGSPGQGVVAARASRTRERVRRTVVVLDLRGEPTGRRAAVRLEHIGEREAADAPPREHTGIREASCRVAVASSTAPEGAGSASVDTRLVSSGGG